MEHDKNKYEIDRSVVVVTGANHSALSERLAKEKMDKHGVDILLVDELDHSQIPDRAFSRDQMMMDIASPLVMSINNLGDDMPKWTQKTIYKPLEPDHQTHIKSAEAKRKRKAEKLKKLSK